MWNKRISNPRTYHNLLLNVINSFSPLKSVYLAVLQPSEITYQQSGKNMPALCIPHLGTNVFMKFCCSTDHSSLGHALLGLELNSGDSNNDMNSEDMKRLQCK